MSRQFKQTIKDLEAYTKKRNLPLRRMFNFEVIMRRREQPFLQGGFISPSHKKLLTEINEKQDTIKPKNYSRSFNTTNPSIYAKLDVVTKSLRHMVESCHNFSAIYYYHNFDKTRTEEVMAAEKICMGEITELLNNILKNDDLNSLIKSKTECSLDYVLSFYDKLTSYIDFLQMQLKTLTKTYDDFNTVCSKPSNDATDDNDVIISKALDERKKELLKVRPSSP
jgi:hypothetical protein